MTRRRENRGVAFFEERSQQREEDRQLWRDTQRQINELSTRTLQMGDELRVAIDRLASEPVPQTAAWANASMP